MYLKRYRLLPSLETRLNYSKPSKGIVMMVAKTVHARIVPFNIFFSKHFLAVILYYYILLGSRGSLLFEKKITDIPQLVQVFFRTSL